MAEGSSKGYPTGSGDGWKSALDDPEVIEVSAEEAVGWSSSSRQKRKLAQVVHSEIIELDADDNDRDGVIVIDEKIENDKNKQAALHMDWPEHPKLLSGMSADFTGPTAIPVTKVGPWAGLRGYHNNFTSPSAIPVIKIGPVTKIGPWDGLGGNHNNVAGPKTATPVTNVGPLVGLGGYHNNVAASSTIPPTDLLAHYYHQFVVALGGEHNKYNINSTPMMGSGSSFNSGANNYVGIPPGVEAVSPQGTSSEMPHQPSQTEIVNGEVHEKYMAFKKFDTVNDHGDHFYSTKVRAVRKPTKAWVKRIQHEWKVLENDLPDTIYVRAYEDRMDLLRAVIVGSAGTPYHDGLFFFDVYFPYRYPTKPPEVSYRSGGLRLNPNLYECGKVCLSLLNTWTGTGCERWIPSDSTMLQVLVSIQALVLNAKPYFNEPGYAMYANTPQGAKASMTYNEQVFLLSCRTMQYSIHNPPKHFEDFVVGHFCNYGRKILRGCKSYMAGAQVGCLVGDGVQDVNEGYRSCSTSTNFKASLKVQFADLLKDFAKIGVSCDEFQNPGAAKAAADIPLNQKLEEQQVIKTQE
ncbi:hypothetical protein SETIT_5G269500v2 [Setaria italica]|uniref:E2 ubiquitin-conjugating enzyme n=2 Tax=Setaria italica TaxID=4555 RepID=A0A368R9G5_SETIT|nr:probable ubiquitin-conjugating enzyme E2 26 [Setaria italica]RCV26724.1 hypothetical protein SETIT_5G269500v2 [Setaria italica]